MDTTTQARSACSARSSRSGTLGPPERANPSSIAAAPTDRHGDGHLIWLAGSRVSRDAILDPQNRLLEIPET